MDLQAQLTTAQLHDHESTLGPHRQYSEINELNDVRREIPFLQKTTHKENPSCKKNESLEKQEKLLALLGLDMEITDVVFADVIWWWWSSSSW